MDFFVGSNMEQAMRIYKSTRVGYGITRYVLVFYSIWFIIFFLKTILPSQT